MEIEIAYNESILVEDAKQIVEKGGNAAYQSVNTAMISTYLEIRPAGCGRRTKRTKTGKIWSAPN